MENLLLLNGLTGKSTIPKTTPKILLKSTDNTVSRNMFVTATGSNTYYFDIFIDGMDLTKEYIIEISSGDSRNVSPNKSMNAVLKNQTLGAYSSYNIILSNNKITFKKDTYIGNINSEIKSFKLAKDSKKNNYVYGEIVVVEWINR